MAVCKMEMLAVGNHVVVGREVGSELGGLRGRRDAVGLRSVKAQGRVVLRADGGRRSSGRVRVSGRVGFRCNAASGDGKSSKGYDVSEVVEKVVHDEKNQLPEEDKKTPEPLPEGEPSPFSPAIETDETEAEAFQGEGVSKDSMIEPPRGLQEGAASASIGKGLGASEESALTADIGGSPVSGPGGHGRDWRAQSSREPSVGGRLKARVEKAVGTEVHPGQQKQMFGPSEASCDEGSSFMAETVILETDGGKSVDDYKMRAQIFSESAVFYSALKKQESHNLV
ncbi:hypothetical protein M758_N004200 [Ceratodon purpureus]|nr:hypothetical protein M758_N004200 [Ceratodon purpureus]